MIRWTGLAPWEFEFPVPGSLTSTFLTPQVPLRRLGPHQPSERDQILFAGAPDLHWRASDSGDLQCKSRGLKRGVASAFPGAEARNEAVVRRRGAFRARAPIRALLWWQGAFAVLARSLV